MTFSKIDFPQDPTASPVAPYSLAYEWLEGDAAKPSIVWLGGFRSDMTGSKAEQLRHWAESTDHPFLRFDYSGHGASGGQFTDGTISQWSDEARFMIETFCKSPAILVGSSMGGWVALRLLENWKMAGVNKKHLAGMVLVAPAPDFTRLLMEPQLTETQKSDLERQGYFEVDTPYGPDPNIFTKALFDDGRAVSVLDKGVIHTHCPVHIVQGTADPDVPKEHALRLMEHLPADDASITFVKDGDHRLSRNEDLALLERIVSEMAADLSQ